MRSKSLVFALAVALSLVFVSCQKDGDAGPEGPQGPPGPAGPQGPQGDTGVANVIYSEWLDVDFEPLDEDSTTWGAAIRAPRLSDDILNEGEIKVYVNFGPAGEPFVFPLPYFDGQFIINPSFYRDTIQIIANTDVSTVVDNGETFFQYRYILIPGGVLAVKPKDVNLDNYAEARKYLRITN